MENDTIIHSRICFNINYLQKFISMNIEFILPYLVRNLYDSLQIYVCFIRLENLVYQNNPFIIVYSINTT